MVEFATRLRQLRKEKHRTQAQVARRIGVTASMVSSYETDIRLPSYDILIKIANLFGVTTDYLLCLQSKRFLDISGLTDEQASVVCDMVNILKARST
ncbi:MAG: helix-turn-helix domain-containing protein [Oscillospiraceae bacterium]|nr:helix-turn-helix domain-containing protein [Oscillospiraceae bacterium]